MGQLEKIALAVYTVNVPVTTTHPEYEAMISSWTRARDVLAGEDAVKAAGERYLSRLDAQTDEDYLAYLNRACFFNATARTADGYVGLIFRRAPLVRLPDAGLVRRQPHHHAAVVVGTGGSASAVQPVTAAASVDRPGSSPVGRAMAEFGNDVDMRGTSLYGYAKGVVGEVVGLGRAGTLVDWNDGPEQRVYASMYRAEDIRNWRVERLNGRNVVTLVVLSEPAEVLADGDGAEDIFRTKPVEQFRVLRLVDGGLLGVDSPGQGLVTSPPTESRHYITELWRKGVEKGTGDKENWAVVDRRVPLRRGKPLSLIPFVFHGCRDSQASVGKLPMADIISQNLDHYRLDADFKHGLHFTALPTAYVCGFDKSSAPRIGSSVAWVSENVGAHAGFLEFKGDGLQTFERAQAHDEQNLAVLGSRLLEMQKRVGETAQAISLRQSGEQSIMGAVAASVSDSLTQVLRWAFWWNSFEELPENVTDGDVVVELNTDFGTTGLMAADLVAVVHAWQCGAMSQDSMLDLFRKSEVLPEGRSNAEEAALIAARPPLVPAGKGGPGIAGGQASLPVGPARGGGDRGGVWN